MRSVSSAPRTPRIKGFVLGVSLIYTLFSPQQQEALVIVQGDMGSIEDCLPQVDE